MTAIVIKATVILAAAWCAAAVLRSRSAALRHAVWTAALAALLVLPLAGLLAPTWTPVFAEVPAFTTVIAATAAESAPPSRIPWLPILYGAGAAIATARFLAGAFRVSWMIRGGAPQPLGAEYGVRVVATRLAPVPMAWGVFRPTVILPVAALDWPADRLRAVLLHETMHHRRFDLLTQAVAQAACCAWWFHPLAWLALAGQRRERERACDDAVLRSGVAPHDYAAALVEVVRALAPGGRTLAPAMADASSLESRVRAVIDHRVDRRPVTRRSIAAIVLAAAILLTPLTTAQSGSAITGTVQDPSGARIPGCEVTAKSVDGGRQEVTRADAAGEYRFIGIPPGQYTLEFAAPGFQLAKATAEVDAGAAVRADVRLDLGQIRERLTISAPRLTIAAPAQSGGRPERVRVGGNIRPARLVRQTRPVYPPELQQLGIEGDVLVRAVILTSGSVNPKVINTVDHRLAKAALDAVSQWTYEPSLLNGEPVETAITITLEFRLAQ